MKLNKRETVRQLVHLAGISIVFIPVLLGTDIRNVGYFLLVAAMGAFAYSEYLMKRDTFKKHLPRRMHRVEELSYDITTLIMETAERPNVRPFKGLITFGLGIGLSIMLFPKDIAILAAIALAIGDSMSTLVGIHFGKHKLPRFVSAHRSWEGTLAAFVSVFVVASFYAPQNVALMTAVTASIVEAFDIPLDDNIAIPLITGGILSLILRMI